MCVMFLAYRAVPGFPLVLAMNRDEFLARPTAMANFWREEPGVPGDEVLAGRDLEAGGTWLGVTRHGRFAAISNFRDPKTARRDVRSRGEIVAGFLAGRESSIEYLAALRARSSEYNDFNLICGDLIAGQLAYLSSRSGELKPLSPGIYGLSNAFLDTPWPKVTRGKKYFEEALGERSTWPGSLFSFLRGTDCASDDELPRTGLSIEAERALSPLFIEPIAFGAKQYGTVSSTVILVDAEGEVVFEQRSSLPEDPRAVRYRFELLRSY